MRKVKCPSCGAAEGLDVSEVVVVSAPIEVDPYGDQSLGQVTQVDTTTRRWIGCSSCAHTWVTRRQGLELWL